MSIMIRVDDFPETKGEPQHTIAAFREFDKTLREATGGAKYLLGVIPGRCRPEHLVYLRDETDCVIGMHGTDHDEARLDRNGGYQFEPYTNKYLVASELKRCRLALQEAVGRQVTVYMPPRNKIKVYECSNLGIGTGFEWVTTGPETDTDVIDNVPYIVHSKKPYGYGRTDELNGMGAESWLIEQSRNGNRPVLALHWTWEMNLGLEFMQHFLGKIPMEHFVDFEPTWGVRQDDRPSH